MGLGSDGQILKRGSRVTQLFNTRQDPWETTDLSWRPQHREQVAAMRRAMRSAATALGDTKEAVEQPYDYWDYYTAPASDAANQ